MPCLLTVIQLKGFEKAAFNERLIRGGRPILWEIEGRLNRFCHRVGRFAPCNFIVNKRCSRERERVGVTTDYNVRYVNETRRDPRRGSTTRFNFSKFVGRDAR